MTVQACKTIEAETNSKLKKDDPTSLSDIGDREIIHILAPHTAQHQFYKNLFEDVL